MKSSTKDKAEGKKDQVKGKIKETGGKAVGNEDLEAEGKGEKIKGKAQIIEQGREHEFFQEAFFDSGIVKCNQHRDDRMRQ